MAIIVNYYVWSLLAYSGAMDPFWSNVFDYTSILKLKLKRGSMLKLEIYSCFQNVLLNTFKLCVYKTFVAQVGNISQLAKIKTSLFRNPEQSLEIKEKT